MSSANLSTLHCLTENGKSLIYDRCNKGSKIEPCYTSVVIGVYLFTKDHASFVNEELDHHFDIPFRVLVRVRSLRYQFFEWLITRYEYFRVTFLLKKQVSMMSKSLVFDLFSGMEYDVLQSHTSSVKFFKFIKVLEIFFRFHISFTPPLSYAVAQ